jgi:ribose transport system permease protein
MLTVRATAVRRWRRESRAPLARPRRRFGILLVWLAIIVVFSALRPATFATTGNLQTILGSQAVLLIIALGLIFPLAAGEFDVSVSGTAGLSLTLVGWLNVIHGVPIGWCVLVALASGLLVGAVNAFFVVAARVESFIATLGMGTALAGVSLGINSQSTGGISQGFVNLSHRTLLGVPLAFYFGLGLCVVVWYLFAHTPLGRYLYFVGAGREVAQLSGINVDRTRATTFLVSGFVAALAGVILASWLGASDPNVSSTYLLPAFAAAFLGSTAIVPGRFNAWGTFVAVYFLVTGITGLELLGLAGWIEQVFYGASLVLAVAIARLGERRTAT